MISSPPSRPANASPVASAFDALAADYDATWTDSFIGGLQRRQVWHEVERIFRPGDRILELGCGTGIDAVRLAGIGAQVHALDVSAEMLRATTRKIEREGLSHRITCELRAVEELSGIGGTGLFDGALSNFGVFNCVERLASTAFELARLLRRGGMLVLCIMGRFCAWETAWHLLHGRPRKAFRRLFAPKGGIESSLRSACPFRVFYPSISMLAGAFHEGFYLRSVRSIGVLVPPSYMEGWAVKRRRLVKRLSVWDQRLSQWPVLRATGDHRLAIFVRRE